MKRQYSFITIIISAFVLVTFNFIFCSSQAKEPDVEKQRKQITEHLQKGDKIGAVKLAEEYLKIDPGNIEVLVTLAESNLGLGKFSEAEAAVNKALAVDPANAWALKTLAKTYRMEAEQAKSPADKKKLLDLAQAKIEVVIESAPDDVFVYAEAALVYFAQGNKEQADKSIKKALKLDPKNESFKNINIQIQSSTP